MEYLSLKQAAILAGMSESTMHNRAIKQTVPVEEETIGQKRRFKIPADGFLLWLEKEGRKCEKRLEHLKTSYATLKRRIENE